MKPLLACLLLLLTLGSGGAQAADDTSPQAYDAAKALMTAGKLAEAEEATQALVTARCVFSFDGHRFTLASLHPGETGESVREATGFAYATPASVPATPDPSDADLALLRGPVCDEMLATYPEFCRKVWGREAATRSAA